MRFAKQWVLTGLATVVLMGVPREAAAFWDWIHELSGPSMMGIGYTCRLFQPRPFVGVPLHQLSYFITAKAAHGLGVNDIDRSIQIGTENGVVVGVDGLNDFTVRFDKPVTLTNGASISSNGRNVGNVERLVAISFDRCINLKGSEGSARDDRLHFWVRLESFLYYSVKHEDDPDGPPVYAFTPGALFELSPTHPGNSGKSVLFYGAGYECFRFWSGAGGEDRRFDPFWRCAVKFRPFAVRINPPSGQRLLGAKALEMGVDTRYFPRGFVPRDFGVDRGPEDRAGGEWTIGLFFSAVLR